MGHAAMLVTQGERALLAAPAKAEAAADVVSSDYYAQHAQIRLTAGMTGRPASADPATEVTLDGADVGRLVECALRHNNPSMRHTVLAAIYNHPETYRQLFEFGLNAPEAFREIRDIVAEALAKRAAAAEAPAAGESKALLPRMPLPAHLQGRAREGS
jgi:hypothetical protein